MGFRPLSENERAGIESSHKKTQDAHAHSKVVAAAPAAVNDQITDSVTAAAPEAVEATEGEAQEAKPVGKNPFKKKG
jgi:hypothetical protein